MVGAMRNSIGRPLQVPCVIALFVATIAGACRVPTVLGDVNIVEFQSVLDSSPASAVPIEIEVAADATLRGVLVPPPNDGPLVLHLLEAGGSVAKGDGGRARTLRQLADLGAGSLILDWTGIGVSSGTPANKHILRDARAMWQAALQHVDGDESRLILRGTSIGALAAADLLQSGARPGAVVLIAPIRAETAARNFAMNRFGRFFGGLLTFGMRPIVDVDILEAIRSSDVPVLLLQPADGDLFVSESECELFVGSCADKPYASGLVAGGHVQATLLARSLFPLEPAFLGPHLPPSVEADPRVEMIMNGELASAVPAHISHDEARRRLELVAPLLRTQTPLMLLAGGLSATRPRNAARWLWLLQAPDGSLPRGYDGLEAAELVEALSLDDPAGELPIDVLADWCVPYQVLGELHAPQIGWSPEALARDSQNIDTGPLRRAWSSGVTLRWLGSQSFSFDHAEIWSRLIARGLEPQDARRQLLRILLIGYGHVHRLRRDEQGNPFIEVRTADGEWTVLNLNSPVESDGPSGVILRGSLLPL